MDYKHTYDTIFTEFQGITNNIYGFGRPFFAPSFFTRPPIFLPVHVRFYPSKWQVDGSLHKAMPSLFYNIESYKAWIIIDGSKILFWYINCN